MAASNGRHGYKLSILPAAAASWKTLGERAVAAGLGPMFALDLKAAERRLRHDPSEWGDPLFDYHQLRMTRRRGRAGFVYVYYAVHEQGRTVFVQQVEVNPHGPLGGPPPGGPAA